MKYLVISDIHGSYDAALHLKDAFEHHKCDQIIVCGDILYHGPRNDLPQNYAPKKVIPLMNSYKHIITAVRGNCEAEVDQMVLEFPCMADINVITHNNHRFYISHGHIYSPSKLPDMTENDYFISGHTHIPTVDNHCLNPGSIALPKNNHPQTYAILDDSCFTIYTTDHKEYMKTLL